MASYVLHKHPQSATALAGVEQRLVPLRQSLRLRLSLLITALIAAVLALFLWAAHRELERTVLRTGAERALAASTQLANVLGQNGTRGVAEVQRLALDPVVSGYLLTPSEDLATAVEQRLKPLATAGQPPVVLLTEQGEQALVIRGAAPASASAATLPLPSDVPSHMGIGPFQVVGDVLFSTVVAEIRLPRDETAPSDARGRRVGFLVLQRVIQAGPNADLVSRLVGTGATVAMGNRTGGIWTDFSRRVAPPTLDAGRSGSAAYRTATGESRVGAVALIEGTPWAVWIDFPQRLVLAPARAVIGRMVLLALACVFLSAIVVSWLAAHLVKPLHDLTQASEAIAAGEYSRRVKTVRRDEIGRLGAAFNTMTNQVAEAHRELEDRVRQRTARLEETRTLLEQQVAEFAVVNQELEAFSYSVSHDLRAPLRHITGFAALVERSATSRLNADEQRWLRTVAEAGTRMGRLIDDLLQFSKSGRTTIVKERVHLNNLVREAQSELAIDPNAARVTWSVATLPEVDGDPAMLRLVLVNLIGNALKYTRNRADPHVDIGVDRQKPGEIVIFVRDNGVGFDMAYAAKLFGVFQRLHGNEEFEGTGIGLANVRRIIHRHGGRTWAEGAVDAGATFYFSLPERS